MSNGEQSRTAKQVRIGLGGDILIAMMGQDEFPIGNVNRLCKTMQEYFDSEGFEDQLLALGYQWRPTSDYWYRHFKQVRGHLRKERKLFLTWVRNRGGTFQGSWQFVKKGEWQRINRQQLADLNTRIDSYNDENGDAHNKWPSLETPYVAASLLTEDSRTGDEEVR